MPVVDPETDAGTTAAPAPADPTKKAATKKAAEPKAAAPKKAEAKKATESKPAKAPKPPKEPNAGEYGHEKSADVAWCAKKLTLFKLLKKAKATDPTSAKTVQQLLTLAEPDTLTPRDIRHYAYHAVAGKLVALVKVEGARGFGFHLTKQGQEVDLKAVEKDLK